MNLYKFWFGRQGWKALWIALRRAHRDSHARKNLFRLLFGLVYLCAVLTWYFHVFRGFSLNFGWEGDLVIWTALGGVLLLAVGGTIYYSFERRAYERRNPSVAPDLKLEIYRETCLLATLLERLASEVGMEKELPPNIEVITRRVLLDRLTNLNLRDDLDPWLLDVLLSPDGHWPVSLKNQAMNAWEFLPVLRWVLGLGELRELTENPKYTLADARSLFEVRRPEKLSVLPSWEIRPARDAAALFFNRCWSELTARGEVKDATQEEIGHAIHARESIQAEGYTADFLIGAQTVPEWPEALLWQATSRAYYRMQMLALLVDVTCGEKPAREVRTLFAQFFAPAPAANAE